MSLAEDTAEKRRSGELSARFVERHRGPIGALMIALASFMSLIKKLIEVL
jgi:hypothetical protein